MWESTPLPIKREWNSLSQELAELEKRGHFRSAIISSYTVSQGGWSAVPLYIHNLLLWNAPCTNCKGCHSCNLRPKQAVQGARVHVLHKTTVNYCECFKYTTQDSQIFTIVTFSVSVFIVSGKFMVE
jgi:hypothetical protein